MIAAELASAAAVVAVLLLTYVVASVTGRHSSIDTAWGVMFALVAVVAFMTSTGEGDDARRWLLLVLTVVWGVRLAVHIGLRSRGRPEDPRYAKMLAGHGPVYVALMVYVLQGSLVLLISQPVIAGSFDEGGLTPWAYAGVGLWLLGMFFEAVGDWQLERYRRDPHRGPVMDQGLWRYTRHPNYFGDACVSVGIWLVSGAWWTVFAPAVMVYLLAFGSGKKVMERHLEGRPGLAEYQRRTSGFFPLPPKT